MNDLAEHCDQNGSGNHLIFTERSISAIGPTRTLQTAASIAGAA
jgi:hypothetical protein